MRPVAMEKSVLTGYEEIRSDIPLMQEVTVCVDDIRLAKFVLN